MRARISLLLLAAVFSPGCVTHSSFINTWNHPGAPPLDTATTRMAVVFISPDPARRRDAEDQMVRELGARGIQAIAAESVFEADHAGSARAMKSRFQEAGVTTVLTMRVLGTKAAISPGLPPYAQYPPRLDYLQLSRYWGYAWGRVYVPGYLLTDTEVAMETLVYSLSSDQLLWGSRSRQVHKYQIPALVAELGDAVPKNLASVGLLAPATAIAMARD
jgi:hypothetical protein